MPEEASTAMPCQEGGKAAVWRADMAEVARLCGDDVARELCEKLPGIRLYVPHDFTEHNPVRLLNRSTARRLMAKFGGGPITIPKLRRSWQETYREVEALLDEGLTTQQIALKLGITQHYVFQVRRKAGAVKIANRPDSRQLSLFDDK